MHSFAHFIGNHSTVSSSISSHLDICCAVQNSYVGSWIVDPDASDHMTSDLIQLQNVKPLPTPTKIILPDGSLKTVTHAGQICLSFTITIDHVLCVPGFKFNLLSVNKLLTDHKLLALFLPEHCVIQDLSNRRVLAVAQSVDGLYKLSHAAINSSSTNKDHVSLTHLADPSSSFVSISLSPSNCTMPSFDIIHARLGHTSLSKMQHISCCQNNVPPTFTCDICVMAKMHRLPFNRSNIQSAHPFSASTHEFVGTL